MAARRRPRDEARRARTGVYRSHIVEAAEQVFAERGFAAAKLQDISRLAGLSMGTIYAIFPSKTALYRAILEERGRELLQLARQVAGRKAPPAEALDALSALYIDYCTEAQVEHWRDIHALQADIFRRGVAAGVFVDEDPGYLARLFSALDQVLLADWVASGMKADRDALVRRLRGQVERSFRRAARAPHHTATFISA